MAIFNFARRAPKLHSLIWRCYTLILLEISRRTRWWCLQCVLVYLARDIRPFVMYSVNGKPRSSLLIESTDSMILKERKKHLKNEKRSRVAATKKRTNTSGVGKMNNNSEDIYIYPSLQQHPLTTPIHCNHTHRFHPLATPPPTNHAH